ncbi:MAG: TonB-dependent receptor domain-containing protein, partial [Novosphingobium sp.]
GYIMERKNSQVDLSTIQPTATGNFNNLVTFNAPGITKIRGIEADLTVKPVEGLTMGLSYAYTYTDIPPVNVTYNAFGTCTGVAAPVASCTAAGQVVAFNTSVVPQKFYIVFTPRNAASGSIDYEVPVAGDTRIKFHLDANYSQATQAFDQFATKADQSFIVNGRISVLDIAMGGGPKMNVSLWGRNLFNEQHVYRRDPSNSIPAVQATATATGTPNVLLIGNNGGILGDYGNFNMPRTFGIDASLKF